MTLYVFTMSIVATTGDIPYTRDVPDIDALIMNITAVFLGLVSGSPPVIVNPFS